MSEHNPVTGEVCNRMPASIAASIIAVKKQVRQIGQDERNEHGKYRYVSVDRFYERIGPMMAEAGIALLIDETDSEVKEGKSGNPWLFAHYALAFMHEDGSISAPMRRSLAMPINGPQTYGAAQSYIEKQFLRQIFKIPTGEKDADEMAQGDDAPARSAPSGNGATRAYNRQQAAPAPTEAAANVERRWREIATLIDLEEDKDKLSDLSKLTAAFATLERMSAELGPATVHAERMGLLETRAARRREKLVGSMEPFDGR